MATGKMSFNFYQNGKHSTLPQKDVEITQDMHLKMSKKIAQLTKVSAIMMKIVKYSQMRIIERWETMHTHGFFLYIQ